MHACSSSYTHQQNERLVHARVQFPMVIRHRSVVRTRKILWAFLKTCRAVQLLHACVVKFKVSGTVVSPYFFCMNFLLFCFGMLEMMTHVTYTADDKAIIAGLHTYILAGTYIDCSLQNSLGFLS